MLDDPAALAGVKAPLVAPGEWLDLRPLAPSLPPSAEPLSFRLVWRVEGAGSPEIHLLLVQPWPLTEPRVRIPAKAPRTQWGQLWSLEWTWEIVLAARAPDLAAPPLAAGRLVVGREDPATSWPPDRLPAQRNPFRTSRLRALPWDDRGGHSPAALADRLLGGPRPIRGAIVAPHGHGKSRLLRALHDALAERGQPVRWRAFDASAATAPAPAPAAPARETIWMLDGFDALPPLQRLGLRLRSRSWRGCLATLHTEDRGWPAALALPTLAAPQPGGALVARIVRSLLGDAPLPDDLEALHRQQRGDVREVLRTLYLRWAEEGWRPGGRGSGIKA